MNRLVILGLAIASLVVTGSVMAADMPIKAPVAANPPNWSGFFLGGSLGGRWTDANWTTTGLGFNQVVPNSPASIAQFGCCFDPVSAGYDSSAFRGGIYGGYNWQVSPTWVAGVEADIGFGKSQSSRLGVTGTLFPGAPAFVVAADSSSVSASWDASLRARVGALITPTVLLYGTGGLAWQRVSIRATCNGPLSGWCAAPRDESVSATKAGWTLGGGVEAKVFGNWLARGEYRYSDFGNQNALFFTSATNGAGPMDEAVAVSVRLKTQIALFGLAYQFRP